MTQVATKRPTWHEYHMGMANMASARATCPRKSVGAAIVGPDNHVVITGYNGAPKGEPHCSDVGCLIIDDHCKRADHAEFNAIRTARDHGIQLEGTILYVTTSPCYNCMCEIIRAGIKKVYYLKGYSHPEVRKEVERLAWNANIRLLQLSEVNLTVPYSQHELVHEVITSLTEIDILLQASGHVAADLSHKLLNKLLKGA